MKAIYSDLKNRYGTNTNSINNNIVNTDNSKQNKNNTIINNYYKSYGYTAAISTVGGFLAGTNSATDIASNSISMLASGVSKNTFLSRVLDSANTVIRSKYVSDIINDNVPSLNLLGISESKIVPAQIVPGERFLANSLSNNNIKSGSSLNFLGGVLKSSASNLITNLASTGTATVYDMNKLLENGLNAAHIQKMSSLGLKYTQNVGFLDPTIDKWKTDKDENVKHTFDKYSGYKDESTKYSRTVKNDIDSSEIIKKYKAAFGNNVTEYYYNNTTKDNNANRNITEDEKYLNKKSIEINNEKITPLQYYSNLGFATPYSSFSENDNNVLDLINILDVGENYNDNNENIRDSIKFKFEDISSSNSPIPIIFRATLTDLSDSISPSWESIKFLGRADSFYSYSGFTRNLSFNFTVYANSDGELLPMWRKINRLYGMCYPVSYENNIAMKAPLLKLTIGDMYSGIYGFFNSLTFSPHGESMWETKDGVQLPHIVTFDISYTIIYEPNYIVDENGNNINKPPITNSHHFLHNKIITKSGYDINLTDGL